MHGAECQLIVGDGSILASEGDEVGVWANATNPDPTRFVPDDTQFHALAGVKVTLFVSTAWILRENLKQLPRRAFKPMHPGLPVGEANLWVVRTRKWMRKNLRFH